MCWALRHNSEQGAEKIDALAGLPALTSLYLSGNQIADCAPAAKLTRHPLFGALQDHRFSDVLEWSQALV